MRTKALGEKRTKPELLTVAKRLQHQGYLRRKDQWAPPDRLDVRELSKNTR